MRKYVLILILIILALILFVTMFIGFGIGNFKVNNYKSITEISSKKNAILSELSTTNNNKFEEKKNTLNSAVNKYNEVKARYEELSKEGKITNQNLYNSVDLYDMDFLWTIIGNYATQKGIKLQLDFVRSSTATAVSSDYVMCDLNFTITGDYVAISDFIYNLEDDDQLKFEISNFLMEKGGENLQATFTVKEVPLNNRNLSSVPTSTSTLTEETSNIEN